jgi:outer membrane immunogenic protein
MKIWYFAIVAMLSGIALAHAADMPAAPPLYTKSAPAAPPQWDWSGFYLGVHGGYGWGHDPNSSSPFNPLSPTNIESKGAFVGGQAGYNWQSGVLLGGLEVDMSWTKISGSFTGSLINATFVGAQSVQDQINYMGTARARFGVLPSQSVLLYGTGGAAWAQTTQTVNLSQTFIPGALLVQSTMTPTTRFGWSAGAGAEAMLAAMGLPHWFVRAEYLHYNFGGKTSTSTFLVAPPAATTTSGPFTTDVVRGGVEYKF